MIFTFKKISAKLQIQRVIRCTYALHITGECSCHWNWWSWANAYHPVLQGGEGVERTLSLLSYKIGIGHLTSLSKRTLVKIEYVFSESTQNKGPLQTHHHPQVTEVTVVNTVLPCIGYEGKAIPAMKTNKRQNQMEGITGRNGPRAVRHLP